MEMNQKNLITVGVLAAIVVGFLWWQQSVVDVPVDAIPAAATSTEGVATLSEKKPAAAPKTAGTQPLPRVASDGTYLIYYLPSGFSPKTLEIAVGKSVRFVNNSGKAMRVSSTDPSNNPVFNSFNQSKTVGQGGTYEYTFTDRGSFTYANYNNPADSGAVVVK